MDKIRNVCLVVILVLVAILSYIARNSCVGNGAKLSENGSRVSVNVYGTSGRIRRLAKTRVFQGRRAVTVPPVPSSCRRYSSKSGRNCERWIVVTTIFADQTEVLRKISALSGWCMVVVADKKGPESMDIPNVDYLDVIQQESCGYRICKVIPWNHFGRKSIGYLYAIEHGAKVIYDTDDDNQPLADAVPGLDEPYSWNVRVEGNLWNPYPQFGSRPGIWPRGFPLSRINDESTKKATVSDRRAAANQVGVVQFLAQHDPDVDAIYRLTNKLPYDFDTATTRRLVVPHRVLSPYNAQATLHSHEAFWGLLLPVTVHGRVSDIWRGYFTQRLLWDIGKHLAFQSPFVVQHRNPHNYLADFDSEMDLYYKTENLLQFLFHWMPQSASVTVQQRLLDMQIELYEYEFIESDDVALMEAWLHDLQCIGYTFPTL